MAIYRRWGFAIEMSTAFAEFERRFGGATGRVARGVIWRPNGTSDWRLKQYQLIPHSRASSDGRLSFPNAVPRVPHGESTDNGQVLRNQ